MKVSGGQYQHVSTIVANVIEEIENVLGTITFKSTSVSVAGRRIQSRITWLEKGKIQLGYYSHPVIVVANKSSILGGACTPVELVSQGLRIHARIEEYNIAKKYGSEIQSEVYEALRNLDSLKVLLPICKKINAEMSKIVKNENHLEARSKHTKKRARKALASTLDHALSSGLSDNEVRDIVKLAFVRHTMES